MRRVAMLGPWFLTVGCFGTAPSVRAIGTLGDGSTSSDTGDVVAVDTSSDGSQSEPGTLDDDGGSDSLQASDESSASSSTGGEGSSGSTDDGSSGPGSSSEGGSESTGGSEGGSTDDGGPGPALECIEEDLGSALGLVLEGTTVGADASIGISCAIADAPDRMVLWTAPAAGDYLISTEGSAYDTAMAVLSPDCLGAELACNDDISGAILQSAATVTLAADQTVVIVIDGYAKMTGAFTLTITAA